MRVAGGPADKDTRELRCVTCSDEGILMRVVGLAQPEGMATCEDSDGRSWEVQTDLVRDVRVGDELMVHAGVALLRLPRPEPQ